jgi:hypothetical protein
MTNPDLMPIGQVAPTVPKPVSLTAPLPTVQTEVKYYVCMVPTASMHRADGKKLPFVNGFLATTILADQQYLDAEIDAGHGYIRMATEDEILSDKMRRDPKGAMREQVRAEIEAELREELERKILAEIAAVPGSVEGSNVDGNKIGGTDLAAKIAATKALRAGRAILTQPTPVLGGIVGSDKINAAAAGSAAGSGE